MTGEARPRGPWINRFATRLFALIFAVLIFWLLGYLVQDIKSFPGPRFEEIEKRHVEAAVAEREKALQREIEDLDRQAGNLADEQQIVGDSSRNLQTTIHQLLEIQRLSIEKDISLSDVEQENLSVSLKQFLDDQKSYQALNQRLSDVAATKRARDEELRDVRNRLAEQRKPAREEYNQRRDKHRLRLAACQLALLLPLLAVAAFLFLRRRGSAYYPMVLAFGGAVLVKVAFVLHEYFPRRYFRYILIVFLLLAVARILVHFIRVAAFPKVRWLQKQYREAYERFLCPVCEYPIRVGPRRFLYWTRRTVNKAVQPTDQLEEPYTCPDCGTALFEACPACGKTRHALLTHCHHCGAEKTTPQAAPE